MNHGEDRNVCPWCFKRFDTRQAVKAHVKSKRHRQRLERVYAALGHPASADTRPEGGDSLLAPFTSDAVPKADAQTTPSENPS